MYSHTYMVKAAMLCILQHKAGERASSHGRPEFGLIFWDIVVPPYKLYARKFIRFETDVCWNKANDFLSNYLAISSIITETFLLSS